MLFIKKKVRFFLQRRSDLLQSKMTLTDKDYSKFRNLQQLTDKEKALIKEKWGCIVPNIEDGFLMYQIYKTLKGFDVNYMPFSYYLPWVTKHVTSEEYNKAFSHKGMLNKIFHNIPQPIMVVNNINGLLYDCNYNIMDVDSVIDTISGYNKKLIIKPAIDTYSGKNVKMIDIGTEKNEVRNILHSYDKNYVVQEVVEQSEATARFNPTSLQTIRIISLYLNGCFSILKVAIRCGEKGSIVDNLGAGGYMIRSEEHTSELQSQ